MTDNTFTLLRLFETRLGIQPKEEYIVAWQRSRSDRFKDREEMYNAILQDFLNKDMADTCRPTIPTDLGEEQLTVFATRGTVLQIIDTFDLTHSTHSLLNELSTVAPVRQVYVRRATDEDVKFPRGMLRWTLTDGTTQVMGIEMKQIRGLDLKTPFGCKLHIKNCQVRRGLLFLDPSNVSVLGGQVPALYGNNMLEELERRFKLRLGIDAPSPDTSSVSGPPSTTTNAIGRSPVSITPVTTTNAVQRGPTTPPQLDSISRRTGQLQISGVQQHQRQDGSGEFDEFGDDMDVDEFEALEGAAVKATSQLTVEDTVKVKQEHRVVELDLSSQTDEATASQALPPEMTVRSVRELLKRGSIEYEVVFVKAKIRKLSKLKITQMGIRIRACLRDLQTMDEMEAILTDEVITKEIGMTAEQVLEEAEKKGINMIKKNIFDPFAHKLSKKPAKLMLDLSILEKAEDGAGTDLPLVTGYQPID